MGVGNGLERRPCWACQGLSKGDMCLIFMETSKVHIISPLLQLNKVMLPEGYRYLGKALCHHGVCVCVHTKVNIGMYGYIFCE